MLTDRRLKSALRFVALIFAAYIQTADRSQHGCMHTYNQETEASVESSRPIIAGRLENGVADGGTQKRSAHKADTRFRRRSAVWCSATQIHGSGDGPQCGVVLHR